MCSHVVNHVSRVHQDLSCAAHHGVGACWSAVVVHSSVPLLTASCGRGALFLCHWCVCDVWGAVVVQVTGHAALLQTEESTSSRIAISNRSPLVDPINLLQANILVSSSYTHTHTQGLVTSSTLVTFSSTLVISSAHTRKHIRVDG